MTTYQITRLDPTEVHYKRIGKGGGMTAPLSAPLATDKVTYWREEAGIIHWEGETDIGEDPETFEPIIRVDAGQVPFATILADIDVSRVPTLEQLKSRFTKQLERNVIDAQIRPIFVGGIQVNTDEKTQNELVGFQKALDRRNNLEIDYPVKLQTGDKVWVKLKAVEVGAMLDAVADNKISIQAQYRAKSELIESAATISELEAIDLGF